MQSGARGLRAALAVVVAGALVFLVAWSSAQASSEPPLILQNMTQCPVLDPNWANSCTCPQGQQVVIQYDIIYDDGGVRLYGISQSHMTQPRDGGPYGQNPFVETSAGTYWTYTNQSGPAYAALRRDAFGTQPAGYVTMWCSPVWR